MGVKRGGRGKGRKRAKSPAWTAEKREIFFSELAEVCNVSAAARAAGHFDTRPIYEKKKRDPEFAARWEEAVCEGVSRLDLELLERARFGENRPADVGISGERQREIPTALALQLLKLHQPRLRAHAEAVARRAAPRPARGRRSLRAEIEAKLSELNRRFGGDG
ncbi:hypothetical protein [Allosphingosinicella sp.]|jgi:hypothetical protein|uniref:hypothetical protein n=1 Tax=Allosphingosinicella sp. TaxID=2823234 RepID=UPI002EF111E0